MVYELLKVYSENFMLMETKKVLTCLKYDQRQADIKVEWGWESITKSGHFDTLTRIWHSGGRDGYEDIVEGGFGLISQKEGLKIKGTFRRPSRPIHFSMPISFVLLSILSQI